MKRRTAALTLCAFLAGSTFAGSQSALAAESPAVGNTSQCSATPLTMAYYRTWRDVTVPPQTNSTLPDPNVTKLTDLPSSIDVAMIFGGLDPKDTAYATFQKTLRDDYAPEMHARGTRLIASLGLDVLSKADIPLTDEAYAAYAQQLVDTYVTSYGLDGIDVDVESFPVGDEQTRAIGVFTALGKLLGPNSGTDKLLNFDTNMLGNLPVINAVADQLSFVLLQAYGRDVGSLDGVWSTFADKIAPCQFLPGFTFPEEQGPTNWGDTNGAYDPATAPSTTAYGYAAWQPEGGGKKGGFFSYGVDRDGKAFGDDTITPTTFAWMKNLSALQDENAGVPPASVSVGDTVWSDTNGNGIQDAGEPGLADVTLTVTGPDGKPVTDVNGETVQPVQTDEDGKYSFAALPPLQKDQFYTVTVATPEGYVATKAGVGDPAADSSTGSAASGPLRKRGDTDTTLDFGFVPEKTDAVVPTTPEPVKPTPTSSASPTPAPVPSPSADPAVPATTVPTPTTSGTSEPAASVATPTASAPTAPVAATDSTKLATTGGEVPFFAIGAAAVLSLSGVILIAARVLSRRTRKS